MSNWTTVRLTRDGDQWVATYYGFDTISDFGPDEATALRRLADAVELYHDDTCHACGHSEFAHAASKESVRAAFLGETRPDDAFPYCFKCGSECEYSYGEFVPGDGESIELGIRDERIDSDVFDMPEGDARGRDE